MTPNPKNMFQPYLVDAAAITERLEQLITRYGVDKIEIALVAQAGDPWIKMHVDNLCNTYTFTEVLEVFECLTNKSAMSC